jgi:hypothetical protein
MSRAESLALAGGLGLLAYWWFGRKASTSISAPRAVSGTTTRTINPNMGTIDPMTILDSERNQRAAGLVGLCEAAPLNSFGPACEGITWVRDSLNQRLDLRIGLGPMGTLA